MSELASRRRVAALSAGAPYDGSDSQPREADRMCFDLDSQPPIAPIAGGSLDHARIVLTAADGNRSLAFRARATEPTGAGIVILPDVRGLHPYYEELALRFAEHGVDALAIDYFGRSAGTDTPRDDTFEFWPHVERTTWEGLSADIRAAATDLRSADGAAVSSLFTVGFCFGGRLAFVSPTLGLGLAGAIGFYGRTAGEHGSGTPAPTGAAGSIESPVLGLFGGADAGIPADDIAAFDAALAAAGVDHRLVTYPGAPHSFFDRKAADFAEASESAWGEVLGFIRTRTIA
jgi:carboxymethylenebutenolidase